MHTACAIQSQGGAHDANWTQREIVSKNSCPIKKGRGYNDDMVVGTVMSIENCDRRGLGV